MPRRSIRPGASPPAHRRARCRRWTSSGSTPLTTSNPPMAMSSTRPTPVTSRSTTSTRASWDEQPAKASTSTTQRRAIRCQPGRNDLCLEGTPIRRVGHDGAGALPCPLFRDPVLRLRGLDRILDGANMELQMRTAQANATFPDERTAQNPRLVWHWYDLICPFCYVGQDRSAVL